AALVRGGAAGLEVLLLRRRRSSGFVPGAWVFPGGRVDAADAQAALHQRADGLGERPAPEFWLAAVREVFEETGVLLGRGSDDRPFPGACQDAALEAWRTKLMEDRATLLDMLAALGARADLRRVAHLAHWVTPVVEPRRYDTQFFLAATPAGCEAAADPREMSDMLWLTPVDALDRFVAGELPMVFPTLDTLERLAAHATVEAALDAARRRRPRRILPRLVRTTDGVEIVVDEPETD
ncbi:MAG: NUDIX hydrolase, partial [Longimicrobiales bacterium]